MTKRAVRRLSLGRVVTRILLVVVVGSCCARGLEGSPDYRRAAVEAANWIQSTALTTEKGKAWPVDPVGRPEASIDLYSGVPGVVLFFLELHRATGEISFLREAEAGADYLVANLPTLLREDWDRAAGLYSGVAGIGFVLWETYKVSKEPRFRDGALACLKLIREGAVSEEPGVRWNDSTDIVSGSAGIGLFLLYAAREMADDQALQLATMAGELLLTKAIRTGQGWKWAMDSKFPRLMPNFSHGTAGIAYFLARLSSATSRPEFLEGALQGANYLTAVAETESGVCLIFHHEPDGENLHYLGWCHGPVGTARLFLELWRRTGDAQWKEWMEKSARGVLQSGIPERRTPGFWNNVSQCCGSAGVAQFFADLYGVTGKNEYLEFARKMAADLLSRATRDGDRLKWVQAEHRVRPEELAAQTGYMQGAAGIGMLLLRLDGLERKQKTAITFPDSPF